MVYPCVGGVWYVVLEADVVSGNTLVALSVVVNAVNEKRKELYNLSCNMPVSYAPIRLLNLFKSSIYTS